MTRRQLAASAIAIVCLCSAGGAFAVYAAEAPVAAPTAPTPPPSLAAHGDIADTLKASGQFTILAKALDQTNLTSVLKRPGPMTLIDTLADGYYGDRVKMAFAFAELLNQEAKDLEKLGVDVVQFDEPAFNVYLNEVSDWGVPALEKAAEGLKCTTAVHVCYGYGIEANNKWKETLGESWRQYEQTFPALDKSKIQQVSLEVRNSHVPPELMKLLKTKTVLVGCIDVASDKVDTPEEVAATLKLATQFVDPERIQACTNCGMAPMTLATAYGKLRSLAQGAALARKTL